uniref:Uncharacterized protein n=1 Tax=Anopheles atroparvus TaxID=41427 RepID=A0A182J4W0_ANOAO
MTMLLLRTLMVACCWGFLSPWELVGAKPMNHQRMHFVLGEHAQGEKVLEISEAGAVWYEGHPVQLDVQYPATAADGDARVRLSCVEVVIIYATSGSPGIPDGPTVDDAGGPRVQFVSGGLGQSYAGVSIVAPAVTYFKHSTVFYGMR